MRPVRCLSLALLAAAPAAAAPGAAPSPGPLPPELLSPARETEFFISRTLESDRPDSKIRNALPRVWAAG